jgi:hypothetical protein
MKTAVYLDSFSGAIGDMTRKDQRNFLKVLGILQRHPRFSVFDCTANPEIANTMMYLNREELMEYIHPGPEYPWMECRITELGRAALSADATSESKGTE